MKRRAVTVSLAVMMMLLSAMGASAAGNTPGDLSARGWSCFNVPGLGVHCAPPGDAAGSATMPLKVFDTSDPLATNAQFLGTELLIRADLYHGQPCPQGHLDDYDPIDLDGNGSTDYYACHHYAH